MSLLLSLPVLCQGIITFLLYANICALALYILEIFPLKGWETGSEYLYDYSGLLVTGIQDADHQSAAVQIIAKLTVQCVDDETLMLKVLFVIV